MVEQSHKDRSETQGKIIPEDLRSAEEDTLLLFDSLSASFPDENVDANLLSQAADFAANSADESQVLDNTSNVVPLYAHEREVSFLKVLPKVFVAAAVLVLAVVVVPLLDNSLISTDLSRSASLPAQEAVSATGVQNSAELETAELLESLDTDADSIFTESAAESAAQSTAESAVDTKPTLGTDIDSDAGGTVLSSDTPEHVEEGTVSADRVSSDTANVVTGVARTTIISTESAVQPSVVQGINVSSAARVQRKILPAEQTTELNKIQSDTVQSNTVDTADQGAVAAAVSPAPDDSPASAEEISGTALKSGSDSGSEPVSDAFVVQQSVERKTSNEPSYRRSIHRWRAEIIKLSRLGRDDQAELEYSLFRQEHPNHQIELEVQSESSSGTDRPDTPATEIPATENSPGDTPPER